MIHFLDKKEDCFGCTACKSICPKKCIKMLEDEEGFLYPVISDDCIHCGKCEKVCPRLAKINKIDCNQEAFVAITKSKKIWERSSSGGAFSEICRSFGDSKTMICGAVWEGLYVKHACVIGVENIRPLCKSKYVASDLNECFLKLKTHLDKGEKAIFCGTPCQVAGLKGFLGNKHANLLTIDLICHGVGSPAVFRECIRLTEKQIGMDIDEYEFRKKPDNLFITRHLSYARGKTNDVLLIDDQYSQLFLSQKCLRPSCGKNCIFRNQNRLGDFTIGDFNGADSKLNNFKLEKRNYSSIVANSEKAKELMKLIKRKMNLYPYDLNELKKYNPLFSNQTWFSEEREDFFNDFENSHENLDKWVKPATLYKISLKRKLFESVPNFLRKMILRYLSHGK